MTKLVFRVISQRLRPWPRGGSHGFSVVIAIGALHGLEPGHGWPLAFLYSTRRERPLLYGVITSGILAFFHFLSSIAVVVVYLIVAAFVPLSFAFLNYLATAVLIVLAIVFWREKVEDELEAQHGHLHGNKDPLPPIP